MIKKLFLSILVSLLLVSSAWAANYYVKTGGNDEASGLSDALAWATIAKVNAATFAAGDSILFNRGNHWHEQLIVPSTGSVGLPITFGAYGTGANPLLDGTGMTQNYGLIYCGIGKQYIDFYNIDIINSENGQDGYQIWDDYVRIYNADISYCDGAGIYFFHNTASGGADYGEAHNCKVSYSCRTTSQAFTVEGSNTWLYDCTAEDNDMAGFDFLDYSEDTNCTLSGAVRCISRRNSQRVGSYDPNFYIDGANNITLESCLSDDAGYNNANYNAGITINTETAGKAVSDVIIKNCIVYGQKGDALTISGLVGTLTDKVYVYNSTFVQGSDGYQVLQIENIKITGGTGITFKNNIFYATKIASWLTATDVVKIISDYNTFYTDGNAATDIFDIYTGETATGYTLAEWQSGFSQDSHSIITDPLFVSTSDFHLQSGSPAINTGLTIATVTDDYEGNLRSGLFDIGAYEYISAGSITMTGITLQGVTVN